MVCILPLHAISMPLTDQFELLHFEGTLPISRIRFWFCSIYQYVVQAPNSSSRYSLKITVWWELLTGPSSLFLLSHPARHPSLVHCLDSLFWALLALCTICLSNFCSWQKQLSLTFYTHWTTICLRCGLPAPPTPRLEIPFDFFSVRLKWHPPFFLQGSDSQTWDTFWLLQRSL